MAVINFTVRTLDSLKAPINKSQEEHWDSSTPGFGVRLSAQGRKVWIVRYKVRGSGELDRETLGRYGALSLADARIAARQYLDAASRGENLKARRHRERAEVEAQRKAQAERAKMTFSWLAEQYLSARENLDKNYRPEEIRILNREILHFWDDRKAGWRDIPIQDITKQDVKELLTRTLERTQRPSKNPQRGKGVHANRVFSLIRRIFNFAVQNEYLSVSPCHLMKRPLKNEDTRERVLTAHELRLLWKELEFEEAKSQESKRVAAIFKIMLLTGQRGNEVKKMEWTEIDFERGVWTLPGNKTKNGKTHTVPLSNQVVAILAALKSEVQTEPWVFPSKKAKGKSIIHYQKAIQRIRDRAGLSFTGHDQRRTLSTWMAQLGIAPHIIERVINHTDGSDVGAIYNRYSYDAEKRNALQLWSDYLYDLISHTSELKVVLLGKSDIKINALILTPAQTKATG